VPPGGSSLVPATGTQSQGPSAIASSVRLHEIDGLRGWAALSVVAFHIFWETFGIVQPGIRNPVLGFFLDGSLAVSVFFVLSGEALSSAFFAGKGDRALAKLAVKRYPRLTIPILATSVLTFVLLKAGAVNNHAASTLVHREDWLGSFLLQVPVSAAYTLKFALFRVYTDVRVPWSMSPFLWTMRIEMLGSLLVFAVLPLFRFLKYPLIALALGALVFMREESTSPFACFAFGMIFSAARLRGLFARAHENPGVLAISWCAVILLAATDGIAHWKEFGLIRDHIEPLAIALVFSIFCNRHLSNFFSSRLSRRLGTISFPVYLIQFPILVTVMSDAIVYASSHAGFTIWMVALIGTATFALCVLAAFLFLPVEVFTRRVGDWAAARVLLPS
jgi:peptidoglycan/LPS O-acetylase OafA/YrhL